MNILQAEDLVKGMPDQLLIQQAKAPGGQIPQYLLVSEVQRRTDMRKRFEAQQQQPEGTVAEQILGGGIGSLHSPQGGPQPPIPKTPGAPPGMSGPPQAGPPQGQPGMPQQGPPGMAPQSMARGGIVNLSRGGPTRMAGGGGVMPPYITLPVGPGTMGRFSTEGFRTIDEVLAAAQAKEIWPIKVFQGNDTVGYDPRSGQMASQLGMNTVYEPGQAAPAAPQSAGGIRTLPTTDKAGFDWEGIGLSLGSSVDAANQWIGKQLDKTGRTTGGTGSMSAGVWSGPYSAPVNENVAAKNKAISDYDWGSFGEAGKAMAQYPLSIANLTSGPVHEAFSKAPWNVTAADTFGAIGDAVTGAGSWLMDQFAGPQKQGFDATTQGDTGRAANAAGKAAQEKAAGNLMGPPPPDGAGGEESGLDAMLQAMLQGEQGGQPSESEYIKRLMGLLDEKPPGVPDMSDLVEQQRRDAYGAALAQLGAGIAAGNTAGGLARAGEVAYQGRGDARDLEMRQRLLQYQNQMGEQKRQADILGTAGMLDVRQQQYGAYGSRQMNALMREVYKQSEMNQRAIDERERQYLDLFWDMYKEDINYLPEEQKRAAIERLKYEAKLAAAGQYIPGLKEKLAAEGGQGGNKSVNWTDYPQ